MPEESYSIEELTARVGISGRTLRYYVAEGLVPGPGTRGKAARYSPEHLWRLLLIRRLTAQRVPLARIRERLSRLSAAQIRELADERPAEPSPRAYVEGLLARVQAVAPARRARAEGETWKRYPLQPGLEVAVRSDVEHRYAAVLGRIVRMLSEGSDTGA